MDKAIWQSKTVWINALFAGVVAALGQFGVNLTADQVASLGAVVNVVLRLISSDKVTLTGGA